LFLKVSSSSEWTEWEKREAAPEGGKDETKRIKYYRELEGDIEGMTMGQRQLLGGWKLNASWRRRKGRRGRLPE
jgi:hypothetical protein